MENQVSLRIDRVRRLYDSRKARKMIEEAVADRVSDIYLVPRGECYQVYHRIMDDREFVQDLAEEEVTAIISHFKFLAGLNVGENAVASRVPVTMIMGAERFHFAYQLSEIIVARKVWLSACSMTMTRNSSSGLRRPSGLQKKSRDEGSTFFGSSRLW